MGTLNTQVLDRSGLSFPPNPSIWPLPLSPHPTPNIHTHAKIEVPTRVNINAPLEVGWIIASRAAAYPVLSWFIQRLFFSFFLKK